jgi:hypothetical protein
MTNILIVAIMFIGYIKLILAMSWYQLLYDITLFNVIVDVGNYPILYIAAFVEIIGGIGASFMSNWIAFVLFYVVVFEKSFDILKNYMYIILSTVIIWLPMVIIYSIGALPQGSNPGLVTLERLSLFYYVKLSSIALNFILIGCILYKNYQVRSKSTTKTPAEIAINTLCRRVMYYPILQTVSCSGYAWYEFQYGFDFSVSQAEHDPERYGLLIYSAIIITTISVGYLILFLYIEPHAYRIFKKIYCGIDTPEKKKEEEDDADSLSTNSKVYESNNWSQSQPQSNARIDHTERRDSMFQYPGNNSSIYSWNEFKLSITNFFTPQDGVHDNRTEDEIFAVIDDIPSALYLTSSSTLSTSTSEISTVNIMHPSSSNNIVMLSDDGSCL